MNELRDETIAANGEKVVVWTVKEYQIDHIANLKREKLYYRTSVRAISWGVMEVAEFPAFARNTKSPKQAVKNHFKALHGVVAFPQLLVKRRTS